MRLFQLLLVLDFDQTQIGVAVGLDACELYVNWIFREILQQCKRNALLQALKLGACKKCGQLGHTLCFMFFFLF